MENLIFKINDLKNFWNNFIHGFKTFVMFEECVIFNLMQQIRKNEISLMLQDILT